MARGKHGEAATRRRLEAAIDHIDRLTDQLAEAKLRVKYVEKQAARVPGMERELEDLRGIVAHDHEHRLAQEVEELRDRLREQREAHDQAIVDIRRIVCRTLKVADLESGGNLRASSVDWDSLAGALDVTARDLLYELDNIPNSFQVGVTGPGALLLERDQRRRLVHAPISRLHWADLLLRLIIEWFENQDDDGVWDRFVANAQLCLNEHPSRESVDKAG